LLKSLSNGDNLTLQTGIIYLSESQSMEKIVEKLWKSTYYLGMYSKSKDIRTWTTITNRISVALMI